jgi:hypothetical protein
MWSVIDCWKRTVQVPGYGGCRFGDIVLGDSGARIAFIVTHWNLERTCSWVGPVCFCLQICSVVGPGRIDSENRTFMRANVKAQHRIHRHALEFRTHMFMSRASVFLSSNLQCSRARANWLLHWDQGENRKNPFNPQNWPKICGFWVLCSQIFNKI